MNEYKNVNRTNIIKIYIYFLYIYIVKCIYPKFKYCLENKTFVKLRI